jgi:hypothetical protein
MRAQRTLLTAAIAAMTAASSAQAADGPENAKAGVNSAIAAGVALHPVSSTQPGQHWSAPPEGVSPLAVGTGNLAFALGSVALNAALDQQAAKGQ